MSDIRFNRWLHQSGTGGVYQTGSGNIGIGTSVPSSILDVNGTISATSITATAGTITGDLSVGGVLTYEDVTNIDSVGIITARSDISIADKIVHTGDTNTAIRFPVADTFTVETAGSERFRVDSDGKVRVGSGDPAYNLEVFGSGSQEILIGSSNANGAVINFDGDSNGDGSGSDYAQIFHHTDGTLNFRARNPNGGTDTIFYSNTTERLRINSGGDITATGKIETVGRIKTSSYLWVSSSDGSGSAFYNASGSSSPHHAIGISDNAAGSPKSIELNYDGSATFAGGALAIASSGNLSINRTTGTNDILNGKLNGSVTSTLNANGLIELGSASNSTNNNGLYLGGHNGSFNLYTTRYNSDCFQILNTSGSGTNVALRAYGNGDVEIAGIIQTNTKSAGNIELDSTGSFTSPKIKLFANTGAAEFNGTVDVTSSTYSYIGRRSSDNTAVFAVADTGLVNVGPVSGNNSNIVLNGSNGTAEFASFNDGSSSGFGVKLNIAANAGDVRAQCQSTASQYTRLYDGLKGTSTVFSVLANGNLTVSGSVTASNVSDIRFKENITDANSQLADAVSLGSQLKNFDWNDDAPLNEELRAKRFLGLVAQEAEKVCPGLTYTVPRTKQGEELTPETTDAEGNVTPATYEELDDSYKAINHDILVMKLLGAVSEQNTQIETLKTQNASLEARLTALEG